ncbi:MAG: AsmA-like C-terminal domain-containing protein [Bradyrhizobium sp.]|uniref:YhdP family protein n=1 Tax=Bradyrhizobium sp. TaxID=376 RepID=UPI001E0FEC87|nr:AsmA-like C-terminal domain-containing protein [Bradyrhizobium sp.]MBV9564234.1 AsmA-like C-terminal domain-containing protein [Bradyrhizobium sp.]
MPAKERSLPVDGRDPNRSQSANERRLREAMARNSPPQSPRQAPRKGGNPRADAPAAQWDAADWEREAGHRAQRLLSRSDSGLHRVGDRFSALQRWLSGERWVKRLAVAIAALVVIFGASFFGLWWRLGAGPINLDVVTPWLAAAIEDSIGNGNSVEVGGTQIERAGRIHIAVRIRDIVVRDHDRAIVATAPKAEVRLSGAALLMGRLRAESLNLVDAELSVRITPDGYVTVSTGETNKPLATGVTSKRAAAAAAAPDQRSLTLPINPLSPPAGDSRDRNAAASKANPTTSGLLAGLDWLDSLSLTGLDGQSLNEIGLKNGNLIVDDQQRGNKRTFDNISLSLRKPSSGGVALSLGEEGGNPWSLRVTVGPAANGVRAVDVRAVNVPTRNILLALRLKDLTYSTNLPLTGELKGELGRDGVPTYFRGKIIAGRGSVIDTDTPDYPMEIDSAEISLEWDAGRRVLVAPFKIVSGANRFTLLAHLEPPNDDVAAWQLGFSGGTIVLVGADNESPLIFNRINVAFRFDTDRKQVLLTQADISNGDVGVAGTGSIDYSGEPQLKLGLAGTPMSASALKRIWPALVQPEVRQWVVERIDRGAVQRVDIAVNAPVKDLPRKGPPIPDDGLSINIAATGVTVRPVDRLPAVHDADLKVHVTGRTANVLIGQGIADTPAGRKLTFSDFVFDVADTHPKPPAAKIKMKVDGTVPAVAEILASDRLSDLSTPIDPSASKGTVSAVVNMAMPVKGELTKQDTSYAVTADLTGFAADKLVMNQKLEANALRIVANNQGYQAKGDVKINGQQALLDYRKPADGDADIKLSATLDDASRARLGLDLGPAVSGAIPVKVVGKISDGDHDSRMGVEADLTALKLDNILPGWVKLPGKTTKATFNVVPKTQSTRFEDVAIEGGGVSIKGSLEVDQNGELLNASFPTYSPTEGDKTSLRAERNQDGVVKVTMRGDVFDGRNFLKSAISGSSKDADSRNKMKSVDFDVDLKLGAVAGFNGEAVRSVDLKMSRRNGQIKAFTLAGKVGRDTPLSAELRSRVQGGREVIDLATDDAGAFLRFTDTYSKMSGGQLSLAMEPPSGDSSAKEGLINVRNFSVKGEAALDRTAAGAPGAQDNGVAFTALRAEFTRQSGLLSVREGVVKGPTIGLTIEGSIDYNVNQVRMSGTIVPLYGLNNMFNQIPIVGLFMGNKNEGLFGVTYEVVGSPGQPVLRINPISAILPGPFRKIMEFNTGKQNNPVDFQPNNNN